jgi:hypothetical protein
MTSARRLTSRRRTEASAHAAVCAIVPTSGCPCHHAFVIESAEEFVRLRTSEDPDEYGRAAQDHASEGTWREVIARFPDMRVWVAQNKTVPLSILEELRNDPDLNVRSMVRAKGTWKRAHPDDFKRLGDPE